MEVRVGQLIITLHSTSDQGRGELYKSHHHIHSILTSPCTLSRLKLCRNANNPVNIILLPPPTAPNPANKSCSFAEMEGFDPGCLSHHILPPLSHSGDRCDISNEMWRMKWWWERKTERSIFVIGWVFLVELKKQTNKKAAFRTDQQTSNVYRFCLTKIPYTVHPLIFRMMKFNLKMILY